MTINDLAVRSLCAIDPGDANCGWAVLEKSKGGYCTTSTGVENPDDMVDYLDAWLASGTHQVYVIEDYRNYPGAGNWGANHTSQLIGVMKNRFLAAAVPFTMQMPSIKKPAAGLMRAKGAMTVRPADQPHRYVHAYDAQRHGWYWVFKHGSGPLGPTIYIPCRGQV